MTGRVLAADNGRPVKRARVFVTAAELPDGRGALTDDDSLREEGKVDQAAGSIKEKAGKAVDAVKDTITGKKRKI